ncbi:MAG: hypothetical protein N2544_16355, partial [Burkholderiales bacterium]|nr:hypothetical protein [Burkholderiales bacterium]
ATPAPSSAAAYPRRRRLVCSAPAVAASAASRYDGRWIATLECEPFEEMRASRSAYPIEIHGGEVAITRGTEGQPGYWLLQGKVTDDGRLRLAGPFVSSTQKYRGQPGRARFDGQFGPSGYAAAGTFGARKCSITMARAG